jgi:acetoin utilization deacetylase AcuC-like enzyme
MVLCEGDYEWVTRELKKLAAAQCRGRLVSALEGGYDFHALGESAAAHVRALMAA